jgi:hypothetical protein
MNVPDLALMVVNLITRLPHLARGTVGDGAALYAGCFAAVEGRPQGGGNQGGHGESVEFMSRRAQPLVNSCMQ